MGRWGRFSVEELRLLFRCLRRETVGQEVGERTAASDLMQEIETEYTSRAKRDR